MKLVVDSHVHILQDQLEKVAPGFALDRINQVRKKIRIVTGPFSRTLHKIQTVLRHLPANARKPLDELVGLAPLAGLLVESTPDDLCDAMDTAHVDYAIVIAHPPVTSNELVLEICEKNHRLIPAVMIGAGTNDSGEKLRNYVAQGARLLKIHPPADGEGPDSPRYLELLDAAAEVGIPVILHTGCIHSHILYKDPAQANAALYAPWFKKYKNVQFILAHMNFHEPRVAMELAEEYPNVSVDTSWQPTEIIGEAVRRIGADRVFFGSDWPLVGHNISVGIARIRLGVDKGDFTAADAELILGQNVAKLLNLEHIDASSSV